jgi:hypothetical protein
VPYEQPRPDALAAAYERIADHADATPAAAINPADALNRVDQVLWQGTNRLSAMLQQNVAGAWGEHLFALRDFAIAYAGEVISSLRTAVASGAILAVPAPTRGRLIGMVGDYGHGQHGSVHVEEYGEHDDQTLVEQFAMPLMMRGTRPPGGSRSEDELVRDAAINERPPLHRDWDN